MPCLWFWHVTEHVTTTAAAAPRAIGRLSKTQWRRQADGSGGLRALVSRVKPAPRCSNKTKPPSFFQLQNSTNGSNCVEELVGKRFLAGRSFFFLVVSFFFMFCDTDRPIEEKYLFYLIWCEGTSTRNQHSYWEKVFLLNKPSQSIQSIFAEVSCNDTDVNWYQPI